MTVSNMEIVQIRMRCTYAYCEKSQFGAMVLSAQTRDWPAVRICQQSPGCCCCLPYCWAFWVKYQRLTVKLGLENVARFGAWVTMAEMAADMMLKSSAIATAVTRMTAMIRPKVLIRAGH
jgi:hypothetical protein